MVTFEEIDEMLLWWGICATFYYENIRVIKGYRKVYVKPYLENENGDKYILGDELTLPGVALQIEEQLEQIKKVL